MNPGKATPEPKIARNCCITASLLLLFMAVFHGSAFFYVKESIVNSNAEEFLKDIVPVLFAHPSVHLVGLAAFGFSTLSLGPTAWKVRRILVLLIALDAALAFYLGGMIPGLLLLTAAGCVAVGSWGRQALAD